MEVFYSYEGRGPLRLMDPEESAHCVRVMRHHRGDEVLLIDGLGTMYRCILEDDNPKGASARIEEEFPGWGGHPYRLTVACAPTKNNDRFEWFVEKAVEIGVDRIVPVIGERSERKVYKSDRARRIALSAAKQSLKSLIPDISDPVSVRDFIASNVESTSVGSKEDILPLSGTPLAGLSFPKSDGFGPLEGMENGVPESQLAFGVSQPRAAMPPKGKISSSETPLKLIACCFEGDVPRKGIREALEGFEGSEVVVMIGPEGDFSEEEAHAAVLAGFIPVHLGPSRLRTETAAVYSVAVIYAVNCK